SNTMLLIESIYTKLLTHLLDMAAHGKNIQLYLMDGKPRILAEKIRPEYIKRQGCTESAES
ncbi:hypothetical protein, partial [Dialister hominis]|uniref:hypothetical protein n=1 Tax=Dialister hominis TaxID=2582419 RepID=UPI00402A47D6